MDKTKRPKIVFNFETRRFENIFLDDVSLWEKAYPDLDILDLITTKIPAWIDGNADRKGRKKQWKRFLINWFASDQERKDRYKT